MKRNALLSAAGIFLIASLAACAGAQSPTAPPPPATDLPATEAATATIPVATDTSEPTPAPATEPPAGGGAVSFAADILPVLESRCAGCHGGQRTEEGLNLLSHAGVMAGSENGQVLVAGDAANSKLATLVAEGKMPKRGPKLTPDQVQLIVDWINGGAQNN
jgi:hypothetical protein